MKNFFKMSIIIGNEDLKKCDSKPLAGLNTIKLLSHKGADRFML